MKDQRDIIDNTAITIIRELMKKLITHHLLQQLIIITKL